MNLFKHFKKRKTLQLSDLFLADHNPNSLFAESYRSLRANINFSFLDQEYKSILITSAGEEEGKTVCTANLSYTLAQAGKTVLMIDADLRKPVLSQLIKTHSSPGLSKLLSKNLSTDVLSGSLLEYGMSDIFRLLSFQKQTGLLKLTEGNEKINILFHQGKAVDVAWLTRPNEKKMAAQLISDKLLTKDQAEKALAAGRDTDRKLGYILLNMGLVSEEALSKIINIHMIEGLRTAMQMKSGAFSFEKFPELRFDQSQFNPADICLLYQQVIIGQEEFIFLKNEINAFICKTPVENLFLLPSGPLPPNPAELLGSERMSFLLSYLNKRFDVLVIDSPPVLLTSEALLLGPQTDGVLFIVKAGLMKRQLVKKAVEQIRQSHANLIGVALNQVDLKSEGYYKYYSNYFQDKD